MLVFDHHTVLVGDEEDDAPLFDNGEGVRKTGAVPQGAHGLAALRGGKLLHKGRGAAEMLIGRSENQYAPLGRHRGQQLGGNAGLGLLAAGLLRTGDQGIAGPVGERLIGAHTHESVAVDVDHRHEHAIRILIVAGGERPFDVLLGP